ncbi:hypothetical protein CVT24_004632 [Panaeolus cyanescens]|uniref:Uncharacterized protein n=1 Tax=Panaeolus cyanescens TaxID=181874 RepID=A0A409YSM7_9AGAR|nr:hypothetical protein CVT24_004632 [Panaeolus cyanescens]
MTSALKLLENYGLHKAALYGDEEGVRRALDDGADVNALDSAGRTSVMCAVAGENWQNIDACDASHMSQKRLNVLKMLLGHADISLFTLNAPQSSMNGVIPLGMAAWLNLPQAVRVLLEESAGAVSVDGMDGHGATALMYAARDGSLEVVKLLVGASLKSPVSLTLSTKNHHSSPMALGQISETVITVLQFNLHSRILRSSGSVKAFYDVTGGARAITRLASDSEQLVDLACASMPFSDDLQPPPLSIFTPEAISRLTTTLISSIRSSEVSFIQSLLFSPSVHASSPPALYPMSVPVLVNIPDSKGWSPIHHCVSVDHPSIDILDALYLAGADVALFTIHEQQTPLHLIARFARSSSNSPDHIHSLHDFILHLIHDLRAPLSALDKDDETCLHIAAEHGHSLDLLMLLLDCDTSGTVREIKNSRGLTALEVAKSEFRAAFGADNRPSSALSTYTIRPTGSFASLASLAELHSFYSGVQNDSLSLYTSANIDIDSVVQNLLTSLRSSSPSIKHSNTLAHVQYLENCIQDTREQCHSIVQHFRGRIEEASKAVEDLQKNAEKIHSICNAIAIASKGRLVLRGITPILPKRRYRDSEDSQLTVASINDSELLSGALQSPRSVDTENYLVSVGTQTALMDLYGVHGTISRSDPAWIDHFLRSPEPTPCRTYFEGLWDVEQELLLLQQQTTSLHSSETSSKAVTRLKQLIKKKARLEEKIRELDLEPKPEKKESVFGSAKAWFKRMMVPVPAASQKLEIVYDLDPEHCGVGHEVKTAKPSTLHCDDAIDASITTALRTSQIVLDQAERDLQSINECLAAAEQFIDLANHSISRTHRVVRRAIKKREAMINDLHSTALKVADAISRGELSPGLLGYSSAITTRASFASISTIYSVASSVGSVAATLTENDDEDTRIIRRLLLRKIEAQTSGAWDEVDKVVGWLPIVKEAVRGVKRRAYL